MRYDWVQFGKSWFYTAVDEKGEPLYKPVEAPISASIRSTWKPDYFVVRICGSQAWGQTHEEWMKYHHCTLEQVKQWLEEDFKRYVKQVAEALGVTPSLGGGG